MTKRRKVTISFSTAMSNADVMSLLDLAQDARDVNVKFGDATKTAKSPRYSNLVYFANGSIDIEGSLAKNALLKEFFLGLEYAKGTWQHALKRAILYADKIMVPLS